jgi:hypothetical protein
MKRFILAAAVAALPVLAFAQDATSIEAIRVSGALSRIELPAQLRNVWADEFDQVKGTYYLANGKTMQLSMWGNRMYAKIDGMDRSQLVAASPYEFVGLDRKMRIRIGDVESSGPITAEITMFVPNVADANEGTWTRLMATR